MIVKLGLMTVWDMDGEWSIDVLELETFGEWSGSLFHLGYNGVDWTFELLWTRSLIFWWRDRE